MSDSNGKWKLFIGPVVTLMIVLGGFIGQYATTQAEIQDIEEDLSKVEEQLEATEDKVIELEVQTAVESNVLETVKQDVAEIKSDVKRLLGE